MNPIQAVIIKERTDDNVFVMPSGGPFQVGMTVSVDLDSRRNERFRNSRTGREASVEVVNLVERDMDGNTVPFPLEMLLI